MKKELIDTVKSVIGKFLSDEINDRNLTIEHLARDAKISKTIIYKILAGEGYTIDSFIALLGAMDMRIEILRKLIEPEQSN